MKKRITALVMSVALLFNVVIGVNTETKTINAMEKCSNISLIEQELKEEIPKTAQEFIKKKFPSIKKVVEQSKEELSLEGKDVINVHIDRPFIIYDLDSSKQSEKVYFPISSNISDEIEYIVSVIGTTDGWGYEVRTDMVDKLNQLGYNKNIMVLYIENQELKAMSSEKEMSLVSGHEESISKKEFPEKVAEVTDGLQMEKVDTELNCSKEIKAKSTAASSDLGYYYLILQNSKGQGNYGLCWAAAVATITNYMQDKNISAKNVADKMKIGYNTGATLSEAQDALRKYGLYFVRRSEYATFDLVKMNINRKSPIYMTGVGISNNSAVGHATTIYGYREVVGEQCLMIWDSAANANKGDSYVVSYNGAATVFSSSAASTVYTWNGTLLNYK